MAEATERQGEIASELPTKYLPGVEYRDLPEPRALRNYLGASVILLATALGSGELVLWPYITTQVGIGLVWLSIVGITVQYFLNMEIERYTLVTGETAVTGFTRLWLPWGVIMILGAILPNTFPGWASSGASLFTYMFGLSEGAVPIIGTIFLIAIALAITLSPVVYQVLEKVEGAMVLIILAFIVVAIIIATDASAWAGVVTQAPQGAADLPGTMSELGTAALLGAIAFAGAGGASNLAQSNWMRDKGMGMGINIPNIVSPITGEEVAAPSLGYVPPDNEENRRRWETWWRIANQEQLITFWAIGGILLVSLSVLVFSTVGTTAAIPSDTLSFMEEEAAVLGREIGGWFRYFFLAAGFFMLLSTNIGIMDYVSRITGDSLKVTFLEESEFWSESKIYATVVWLMAIGGTIFMWMGIEPIILLVLASTGGGFVMAFYSVLLIMLNRRALPEFAKLKGWRVPVMVLCAAFFIFFSIMVLYQAFTQGWGSLA